MSLLEIIGTILTELEKVQEKLDRLLASGGDLSVETETRMESSDNFKGSTRSESKRPEPTVIEKVIIKGGTTISATALSSFALPMTGKYQWYRLKGNDKVKLRKCTNAACLLYLKFNEDSSKYEHWKYDANTGEGGFVQDKCDYYFPEGT